MSTWTGRGDGTFVTLRGVSRVNRPAGLAADKIAIADIGGTPLPDLVVSSSQAYGLVSLMISRS